MLFNNKRLFVQQHIMNLSGKGGIHERNNAWNGKHVHLSGRQLGIVKVTLFFCLVFHSFRIAPRSVNNSTNNQHRLPPSKAITTKLPAYNLPGIRQRCLPCFNTLQVLAHTK
ncbi:unnamed protein product [Ectocarpus sp. 12 AP-2014]